MCPRTLQWPSAPEGNRHRGARMVCRFHDASLTVGVSPLHRPKTRKRGVSDPEHSCDPWGPVVWVPRTSSDRLMPRGDTRE
jgi:hypothetical protein